MFVWYLMLTWYHYTKLKLTVWPCDFNRRHYASLILLQFVSIWLLFQKPWKAIRFLREMNPLSDKGLSKTKPSALAPKMWGCLCFFLHLIKKLGSIQYNIFSNKRKSDSWYKKHSVSRSSEKVIFAKYKPMHKKTI